MRHPRLPAIRTGIRHQLAVWISLVALALTPAFAHAQGTDGTPTTGDPEADALIADIERVAADFVEAREGFRSDHLDPGAVIDATGPDPLAILEWVASETHWLPYEGALRGASGVLMDRSGSSLDRALLLADLLRRTGLEVQLANTMLPPDTASSLAAAELARPSAPEYEPLYATAQEIEGIRASVRSAAEELASDVGLLDAPLAGEREPAGIIADHWWVRAGTEGLWVDYDPLFTQGAEDRPPAETIVDPAALPEELRHAVTLRVVIERHEDGALIEEVPLKYTLALGTEATSTPTVLDFGIWVPPELAEQAAETTDVLEGARISASWRPRLRVDGGTTTGDWFSEAGRIEPPGTLAQGDALSSATEGLGGLGGEPAEPSGTESVMTAAWIEYVTSGPGLEPRTERRELFDLVGGAREGVQDIDERALASDEADLRRGLAFLGATEILVQAAAPHPDALLDALMENWIELRPALIALVFLSVGADDERIGPSLAAPATRPIDLMAMTDARGRWAPSPATFIGSPQVWSRHDFYVSGPEAAENYLAVDIVLNDTDVLPSAGVDPRLARLEQGILDTLVEHTLNLNGEGLNTWERFARRGMDGEAWTVLPRGAMARDALADVLPPADLARIDDALLDGDTVVVASEPRLHGGEPFADWWRIAEDGTTLGHGYRGWGTELTEEGATTQPSMQTLAARKEAARVEGKLAEFKQAYEAWIRRGGDPYAHLRDHPGLVNPFAETQPIIAALADTLPLITAL